MVEDDVQLIRKVLSGEDAAFSTLVQKYQKSVHAFAWRKIGDFHFAEEITQDTFVQVYQNLSTLRNPNLFAGWLYVIANRLCIRWKQKRKSMSQSLEGTSVSDIDATSYNKYTSEQRDIASTERRLEIVDKLLRKLPESERTVITLFYLGEMTAKEIGMFLGVSINTIKSRLRRARERLKSEEAILQENLSCIQFPTQTTEDIMRRISQLNPTGTSGSKPLVPIGLSAVSAMVVLLLMGVGGIHLHRFQKPYSLEPTSERTIEMVDTQLVLETPAETADRNQVGHSNAIGRDNGTEQQPDTPLFAAADADDTVNSDFDLEWVQAKGPEGGAISTLFTTTNGDIFAGTLNGLYRLTDDHTTWQLINPIKGPSPPLYDDKWWWQVAEKEGTLYLATDTAILKSTDRGETWEKLCDVVNESPGHLVDMVLIDGEQGSDMTIYIAYSNWIIRSDNLFETWTLLLKGLENTRIRSLAAIGNTLFAGTNKGLYRLNGDVWKQVLIDQENTQDKAVHLSALAVVESNLYVAVQLVEKNSIGIVEDFALAQYVQTAWFLYHSNDMGDTWNNITPKQDVVNNKVNFVHNYSTSFNRTVIVECPSIKLTASGEKILLIVGESHSYSTNSGETWTKFDDISNINNVSGVVLLNDDTVYRSSLSGIHRTNDGGASWHSLNTGIINTFIHQLVVLNNTIYANIGQLNVVRSTDSADSWTPVAGDTHQYTSILESDGTLYAMNEVNSALKLYQFSDDEDRFVEIPDVPVLKEVEKPKRNKVIVERFGFSDKETRKPDTPANVQEQIDINLAIKDLTLTSHNTDTNVFIVSSFGKNIAVSPTAYYVEYKKKLYRWKPGTTEWKDTGLIDTGKFATNYGNPDEFFNSFDLGFKIAVLKDTVYVGMLNKRLMQSFDEGETWNDVTADLPFDVERFKEIVFVGETVYVATDKGVASSANGVDWETITDTQGNLLVVDRFAVDKSSLYGLSKNIVYQLTEKSETWRQVTTEITQSVSTIEVDGNTVYVGTQGQGVYRYSLDDTKNP